MDAWSLREFFWLDNDDLLSFIDMCLSMYICLLKAHGLGRNTNARNGCG